MQVSSLFVHIFFSGAFIELVRKETFIFNSKKNGIKNSTNTAQNMKFPITDFFNKCDQIRRKLQIWSNLLKVSVMGNSIFCAV